MTLFSQNTPRHTRLFELMRQRELALQASQRDTEQRHKVAQAQWETLKSRAMQSLQR